MTPAQREKYIKERLAHWLAFFRIDPDLAVSLRYATNNDDGVTSYGEVHLEGMRYGRATITIYDKVLTVGDAQFKAYADATICHEVLHLALYPLVNFCANALKEHDGLQDYLIELEEQFITKLERSIAGDTLP